MVTSLYVSDIPKEISNEDIEKRFSEFKGYKTTRIKTFSDKGKICFIDYETFDEANFVISVMQNFKFNNNVAKGITVKLSDNSKDKKKPYANNGFNNRGSPKNSNNRRRSRSRSISKTKYGNSNTNNQTNYRNYRRSRSGSYDKTRNTYRKRDNNTTSNNNSNNNLYSSDNNNLNLPYSNSNANNSNLMMNFLQNFSGNNNNSSLSNKDKNNNTLSLNDLTFENNMNSTMNNKSLLNSKSPINNQESNNSNNMAALLLNLINTNNTNPNLNPSMHNSFTNPSSNINQHSKNYPSNQEFEFKNKISKLEEKFNYTFKHPRKNATNIVFIEGLPDDATEREVAHILRPFPGFLSCRIKETKKEINGKKNLICFCDFEEVHQATICIYTLQGYRFDKKDLVGLHFGYGVNKNKHYNNNKY